MFGSNDNIAIFILATKSIGPVKWCTDSKGALIFD